MLTIIQEIISTLLADTIIQGFVSDRIFPEGIDIVPETTLFPLITIHNISERTLTNPKNEREITVQISIWSRKNQLEVEQISEAVLSLLNYQQFHTGYGTTIKRWQREDSGVDIFESDRRIWQKAISFRIWAHS